MLIYSPESVYSAVMFQAISIAERNEYNTGTLTRDIVLKFVDGQWLVSEVITALK